ncbi:hypothetical protein [Microbacterium sp.]|uniref:hypothetical protein n=1 Tax=Microbacterium sp. TaxID=51671 RepID=UPI003C78A417
MKTLKIVLYVVGGTTIAAALALIAMDHLLLGSLVSFAGLVPAGLLVFAISRRTGPLTAEQRLANLQRYARLLLIIGIVGSVCGAVLALVAPGSLSMVLLGGGPGMLLGYVAVRFIIREEKGSAAARS